MKKKDRGYIIAAIVVLVILAAAAIVLGVFSSWYTNWDTSTWFGGEEETESAEETVLKEANDNLLFSPSTLSVMRLSVTDISSEATVNEDTDIYLLSATVEPVTATNQNLSWSIEWADSENEWASAENIDEYITLSVSDTDSKSCKVTCLQPFGAQAIIKCVSDENSDIYATCTVDYTQKLVSAVLKFNISENEYIVSENSEVPYLTNGVASVDLQKTVGSIVKDNFVASVSVSATDSFIEWLEHSYGDSYGSGYDNVIAIPAGEFSFNDTFFGQLIEPNTWGTQVGIYGAQIFADIVSKLNSGDYIGNVLRFTISVSDGESTQDFIYECDMGEITFSVDNVSLNQNEIVF